jgi:hypothetical protein
MTSRFLTTRRRILQQLGIALGSTVIGFPARSAQIPHFLSHESALSAALDQLIVHTGSAAVVGEAYLAQFDDERSASVLTRRILASLPPELKRIEAQALHRRIRADFECGDVVNLHGWLLSRTEARLCALYAV